MRYPPRLPPPHCLVEGVGDGTVEEEEGLKLEEGIGASGWRCRLKRWMLRSTRMAGLHSLRQTGP